MLEFISVYNIDLTGKQGYKHEQLHLRKDKSCLI